MARKAHQSVNLNMSEFNSVGLNPIEVKIVQSKKDNNKKNGRTSSLT